ncbi:MAG: flagellar hook protein FlgE [Xylanivirga thermophila]|uniref:flagellar hook protein FlgE n=1 Tax=Xylanivirga thermophila TaxID=2496273 RepID=UPI0039F58DCE
MLRSMFSGVSGLRAHQMQMDVIGNNISNVNTVGYKSSRVTFQEIFSQTLKPSSAPAANGMRGGTNAQQVGLGVSVGSIDVLHNRTGVQRTDKVTDLSIEGDGFFVVSDGTNSFYTRAGNFDVDRAGNMVAPGGLKVLGWKPDEDVSAPPKAINVANLSMPPAATKGMNFSGNLDVNSDNYEYTVTVFDSLGREHKLKYEFKKTATPNEWEYTVTTDDAINIEISNASGKFKFKNDGKYDTTASLGDVGLTFKGKYAGTESITLKQDFSNMTQNGGPTDIKGDQQGGYAAGVIDSISIDANGYIIGLYTNGQSQLEWKIAMGKFTNPAGLTKIGNNMFQRSSNSGEPSLDMAGVAGRGVINPGTLEMSNVDLAKEFTDMIVAQRGFQANSRIITTSDELLQELVNLKR